MKSPFSWKVEKFLLVCFIFIFMLMVIWIKFLGATEVGILVEKDGYCKSSLGDDWDYSEREELCKYKFISENKEPVDFTEEEFRNICIKNKFLSTKFYSNCFKVGDNR